MVTIRQIAEEAGVSRGTVDRVINYRQGVNPDTEKRVREIAERLGYKPSVPGKMLAAKKKKIKIGFLVFDTPVALFFRDVYSAAKQKALEMDNLGISVKFYKAKQLDEQYLAGVLEQVEKDQLDGLILAPLHLPVFSGFLKRIEKSGIPAVFYNVDNDEGSRLSYVGCDYKESGRVAAGLTALSINNKGPIGIATVLDEKSPSSYERLMGFRKEIKKENPDITIINEDADYIFQENNCDAILELVEKHPEMKALYVINPGDCSIFEKVMARAANKDLKIITNDLLQKQRQLLKKGIITATIGQQPDVQGTLPIQMLYDYLVLGSMPQKDKIYSSLQIYIKQNL